jgi:hypothetical protein
MNTPVAALEPVVDALRVKAALGDVCNKRGPIV